MWTHHLRLALRALARDKTSAALGGLSLAVAVAACVLISLFVREELSYDRALPNADRVSTVATEDHFGGERHAFTATPYLLASTLVAEAPAVEAASVTYGGWNMTPVLDAGGAEVGDEEVRLLFADSLYFDVLAYPAVAGDVGTALDTPDGAVITASTAQRLFRTAAPLGRTLTLATGDTNTVTVRAVVADPPELSSFPFDVIASFAGWRAQNPDVSPGWSGAMYQTYVLRRAGTEPDAVQRALDVVVPEVERSEDKALINVPLREYRLSEFSDAQDGFGGSLVFVRLFAAVAGLILLLGAINYVNLATARGARRAKEIGVRKALGAGRGGLVRQFLVESVVLSALAALVGLALAALALPLFNGTFGTDLALADLDGPFLLGLGGAVLAVGVLAGLYPALYLSRFDAARVLRGGAAASRTAGEAFLSRTWLRRGLVVFQFAAAVLLLVGTGAVARQLDYIRSKPLGLDPDGLVVVPITDRALAQQSDVVKAAFLRLPEVVAAAGASVVPPKLYSGMANEPDPEQPGLGLNYRLVDGDADYADALGLGVVAGRWFQDTADDDARAVVVNESFADALGWTPDGALGREVETGFGDTPNVVVGVVADFHFASLREPVGAVAIGPDRPDGIENGSGDAASYPWIAVRLAPGRDAEGVAALRAAWAGLAGDAPFEPWFVADDFAELSASEERLARTFAFFAGIAVLIAALGLVGLAAYSAERRTKEVGIRKVLGASVGGVVALLSREYLALVAVAAVLAAPVAVVLVRRWLEGFAYHAPFSPLVLVGAALAALALALLSVGTQALRAARRDPVRALRSE
ncbi:ABC transporter permease [Rubrivirga sp. S365]|uniref:ABC transporter permease n=1 Tax=Rubrivirga litoralis TaxID=3075598 RepID=A0ABU3BTD7_9BACT|nr:MULTISPECIES: FtsX-like permease family protein [unclassified Rubrivirga]MDT0632552.1 ABC transporter permease [Rubrivirga sp. F394]MDT7856762.1 ABC transporter permease [Rubrivirga sp. S365]